MSAPDDRRHALFATAIAPFAGYLDDFGMQGGINPGMKLLFL